MKRSLNCIAGLLASVAIMMMAAQPALATIEHGKSNNQQLVGCDKYGNWSFKYGTNSGNSKVFKYVKYGIPGLVIMKATGCVTNKSRRSQRYRNIPVWIQDPDHFWLKYPAQKSSTLVLTLFRKTHGLNMTTATFRLGQKPPQPKPT